MTKRKRPAVIDMRDRFDLSDCDLWPEFTYEWMPIGKSTALAQSFGWMPVAADEHPELPSEDGLVVFGGMMLLRLPESMREHWQKRTAR